MLEKALSCGESWRSRRASAVCRDIDEGNMKRPVSSQRGRARGAGTARVYHSSWRRRSVVIFAVLAFQIAIPAWCQVHTQIADRSLSGRVTSSSGTPVANARLVLKNSANSDTTSATVNSDGTYLVPDLSPGVYQIIASAQGFVDANTTVVIGAESQPVANLVMQPERSADAGSGHDGYSIMKG